MYLALIRGLEINEWESDQLSLVVILIYRLILPIRSHAVEF